MNITGFMSPQCAQCGKALTIEEMGFCLLCAGLFCHTHLVSRKELTTCSACTAERLARESASAIADADEDHLVSLLTRDVASTIGAGFEHMIVGTAARIRLYALDLVEYQQRVVDDVQQQIHDEFIDTSWPKCPRHPNHPLWCSDGQWRCEQSGEAIAALGEL